MEEYGERLVLKVLSSCHDKRLVCPLPAL